MPTTERYIGRKLSALCPSSGPPMNGALAASGASSLNIMIVFFVILFEVLSFSPLPRPSPQLLLRRELGKWGKLFPGVEGDVGKWGKARSGACSVGSGLGMILGEKVGNDLASWGMIFQLFHRET